MISEFFNKIIKLNLAPSLKLNMYDRGKELIILQKLENLYRAC